MGTCALLHRSDSVQGSSFIDVMFIFIFKFTQRIYNVKHGTGSFVEFKLCSNDISPTSSQVI